MTNQNQQTRYKHHNEFVQLIDESTAQALKTVVA